MARLPLALFLALLPPRGRNPLALVLGPLFFLRVALPGTLLEGEFAGAEPGRLKGGLLSEAERSGILALHSFLREADPHHQRLGLKRMPTYTGDYLWLCDTHYQAAQPKIPDRIE